MTDHYAATSSQGAFARRDGPVTPDGRMRFSYDHGERAGPSTIDAFLNIPTSPERPLAFSDDELLPRFNAKPRENSSRQAARERRARRAQRPQNSGGFLLQDAVAADDDHVQQRRQTRYIGQSKGKDVVVEPFSSSLPREFGLGIGSGNRLRPRIVSPDTSQEDLNMRRRDATRGGSKHQGSTALDVDSTQIVNMALNLSESRRIASRRNFARTNPPRLAPMQDSTQGSNLKAHLQQQRKTSRAISPRPNQALSPRLSGVRSSSPLRPPFDTNLDASYKYHFSTSTLARAQKAREHLELMSQYRRLLEFLPPLKRGYDRPSATSPPQSPANGAMTKSRTWGSGQGGPSLGREYNPLQYIRNRRVRARERRSIDGDKLGFSDIESVKMWIERTSERASSIDLFSNHGFTLPPFPAAEEDGSEMTDAKAVPRLRRHRVDWFFEPSDLVADAYWLEQNGNKQLIEDRNWCKIFPHATELSRPLSRQTDEPDTGITPFATKTNEDVEGLEHNKDFKLIRPDTDNSQGSSARERAKQKLHDIGGFHRHNPSHSHHDFLRVRRNSDSSLSGSDAEANAERRSRRARVARAGTLSSNTNDLLEKQMLEMIAREAQEQQVSQVPESHPKHQHHSSYNTPERVPLSNPSSHTKGSLTDPSDSDHRSIREQATADPFSRYQLGRNDFAVPGRKRYESVDIDSPQPMSPELTAQDNLYSTPTGLDLSAPSSRSSSPSRNPFNKVKQIFRDKSREEAEAEGVESGPTSRRPSIPEQLTLVESKTLPEPRPATGRPAPEGHRYQRSTNSARLRGDESVGLRGIFKGPRIDTVIRGGVSRLGDMLWKRDNPADPFAEAFSTDESDTEQTKGRTRLSLSLSRTGSRKERGEPQHSTKHFLDTMPQFQPLAEVQKNGGSNHQRANSELVKTQTNQSARFEALKPPKLDLPSTAEDTPAPIKQSRYADVEMSEESSRDSVSEGLKAKDKDTNALVVPEFEQRSRRAVSRHWSIADRDSPQGSQLSRREVARLRALILTSGIKAMEISRRAQELKKPLVTGNLKDMDKDAKSNVVGVPWPEIAMLAPIEALPPDHMVATRDHFALAGRSLGITIKSDVHKWQKSADRFQNQTRPHLDKHIWRVRSRIADDLSGMTGDAADQADETSKDLALGQRLKVKHAVDIIEKLSRNRRRRFRWIRRGLWLAVEWVLVGFMWYVWFVVMIFRVLVGLGQGAWSGVKWLLWL